jgi:hypothetical protein
MRRNVVSLHCVMNWSRETWQVNTPLGWRSRRTRADRDDRPG